MAEERIQGTIVRVIYKNDETNYCVIKVEDREGKEIVLVGRIGECAEGMYIDAYVERMIHEKYGVQFKVQSAIISNPEDTGSLEHYLASAKIWGVGPKIAKRLTNYFGKDLVRVLDEEPERLTEVPGIGQLKAREIIRAWKRDRNRGEVISRLLAAGLSQNQALKVMDVYGEKAAHIVYSDPYRLVRDIWGIGFKTADRIAGRVGISEFSRSRLKAALEYVLTEAANQEGHCYLDREVLLAKAKALLDVEEALLEEALEHLIEQKRVVVVDQRVAIRYLYEAEVHTGSRLRDMANQPFKGGWTIATTLERFRGKLDDEQMEAARGLLKDALGILTGGPGTGKTTLIKALANAGKAAGFKVALASPTGRASRRLQEATGMKAQTIHRLLEFDPKKYRFTRNADRPLEVDWVIVDEASMVDIMLMASLVEALPEGASLTLVGDRNQLPPVGPGAPFHDLIQSGYVNVVELKKVFRQKGESNIIKAAQRVLEGKLPIGLGRDKSDFYYIRVEYTKRLRELITHLVTERIPYAFNYGYDDIQVLVPSYKGSVGADALNIHIRNAMYQGYIDDKFFPGDRVIQIRNNYDKEVFNGDIGYVKEADDNEVIVDFDGRLVSYLPHQTDELKLAYAITIHKSQGSEFRCVVVVLTKQHMMMMNRSLLYTAITRGKELVVLVGEPYAVQTAVENTEPLKRNTLLPQIIK